MLIPLWMLGFLIGASGAGVVMCHGLARWLWLFATIMFSMVVFTRPNDHG